MTTLRVIAGAVLVCLSASQVASAGLTMQAKPSSSAKPPAAAKEIPAQELDGLLAPVALYPDQLLAQMLLCATTPARVTDLDKWLKTTSAVQRHGASGRCEADRVRTESRHARPVPSSRGLHGHQPRLDDRSSARHSQPTGPP